MTAYPDEPEFFGVGGNGRTDAFQQVLTAFDFATEAEACAKLDSLVLPTGCFRIHKEVRGWYMARRPGCKIQEPRIDRILSPTAKLIEAGWPHGPIGIECKTSGKKVGRCISQSLDYSHAVWEMPKGFWTVLQWIFIWPLDGCQGDIGSIIAQNRIGFVTSSNRCPLTFGCAGTHGIVCKHDGTVEAKALPMGNKVGSR